MASTKFAACLALAGLAFVLSGCGSPATVSSCDLSASYKTLSATCSIPKADISDDCCASAQAHVNKFVSNPAANGTEDEKEAQESANKLALVCPMKKMSMDIMKCTESVTGGGATGCSLHANIQGVSFSCDIPQSTTISSDCCDALQSTINEKYSTKGTGKTPVLASLMTKCQSVLAWGQGRIASATGSPDDLVKALPAGLSCTEERPSNTSQSIIKVVQSLANGATAHGDELESQPTASPPSLIPMIAVAGAAGVLGGLVAFFAASKASSKSQRAVLISDDA